MTRVSPNLSAAAAAALSVESPASQNAKLGERIGGIETALDALDPGSGTEIDNAFTIENVDDNTKVIAFDASAIMTGTIRTLTVPDASGTIALIAATQSLTNKTLSGSTNTIEVAANNLTVDDPSDATKQAALDVSLVATGTKRTLKVPNVNGTILTNGGAIPMSTPTDPTGVTDTTGKMAGLAGAITPLQSTRVLVTISGQMSNGTINDGVSIKLKWGTGTAPSNGDAPAGTQVGAEQIATSLVALQRSGFSITAVITGLTIGTAIWLDAQLKAITGGTAGIFGVTITAVEI